MTQVVMNRFQVSAHEAPHDVRLRFEIVGPCCSARMLVLDSFGDEVQQRIETEFSTHQDQLRPEHSGIDGTSFQSDHPCFLWTNLNDLDISLWVEPQLCRRQFHDEVGVTAETADADFLVS